MNTASIVTLTLLGFTWGYQPLDQETTEYIVQLRQHELQVLTDGTHEIISVIPPEARPVGRIRILVGTDVLPRLALPPKALHVPVEPARPATAHGYQGRDNTRRTDWRADIGNQGGYTARNPVVPTNGRAQPNPSWTSVYGTRTNRWGGVDPLVRPGPADDASIGGGWLPPLALPSLLPSHTTSVDCSVNSYRTSTAPWVTGPAIGKPRDGRGMVYNGDDIATTHMTDIQSTPRQPFAWPSLGNGNTSDNTTRTDRRGVVEAPPLFERGQGIGYSKPGDTDSETHGRDSRIDWNSLAGLPTRPDAEPNKTESENTPPETQAVAGRSPSNKRDITPPVDDNSPWRVWALLLGPVAIALAGLNVYQWGIYKSVRHRYLTLLRRSGEI